MLVQKIYILGTFLRISSDYNFLINSMTALVPVKQHQWQRRSCSLFVSVVIIAVIAALLNPRSSYHWLMKSSNFNGQIKNREAVGRSATHTALLWNEGRISTVYASVREKCQRYLNGCIITIVSARVKLCCLFCRKTKWTFYDDILWWIWCWHCTLLSSSVSRYLLDS